MNTPDDVIEKLKIFMLAKSEGMERKQGAAKRDMELEKFRNKNG